MMSPVLANVVWPALLLAGRLAAWWCIGLSILIEGVALWRFGGWRPVNAFFASAAMNTVSAFCGVLLLPVAGLRWEAGATFYAWFGWSTFSLANEAATWVIAVLLNTLIETFVLWLVFCAPWTRKLTFVVLSANAVTVLLTAVCP